MNILNDPKIRHEDAIAIFKNSNRDLERVKKAYDCSKNLDIENLVGFMVKMVMPGILQKNIKKPKKEPFIDYTQRTNIDFKKLEREYQGWDKVEETSTDIVK